MGDIQNNINNIKNFKKLQLTMQKAKKDKM